MSTNYPSSIDTYTTHVDGDIIEPEFDNNQQDAIIALQTKLGIDNSVDTTTIDYKLKSTSSLDPGHKHTPTVSLAITGTPDGTKYLRDDNTWSQPPTVADASTTVKGSSKLSVAPVSASDPIAVGDNDGRVPTQAENDALVGNNTDIAVGSGNKFITQTGQQKNAEKYAADAGGSDAYAITLAPVPTSYSTGMVVHFKANTANTGAATLDINSLGAKTIKKEYNVDLDTGDILANQLVSVIYDGTNFQMISPVPTKTYNGVLSLSSSTTTTVTCGFRPKLVVVHAVNGSTNYGVSQSNGSYSVAQNTNRCHYTTYGSSGGVFGKFTDTTNCLSTAIGSTGTDTLVAYINNVTGTGFDIVSTVSGAGSAAISYEVFG